MLKNCHGAALDGWSDDGGYLVIRSVSGKRRPWPHVMHASPAGLQNYCPGAPLSHPINAVFGYDGVTFDRETGDATPVRPVHAVVAMWVLALSTTAWWVRRLFRG